MFVLYEHATRASHHLMDKFNLSSQKGNDPRPLRLIALWASGRATGQNEVWRATLVPTASKEPETCQAEGKANNPCGIARFIPCESWSREHRLKTRPALGMGFWAYFPSGTSQPTLWGKAGIGMTARKPVHEYQSLWRTTLRLLHATYSTP